MPPKLIVFDVDGTILPGTSCERLFVRYLVEKRVLRLMALINFCIRAITLVPMGRYFVVKANKGYLRGFPVNRITEIAKAFFHEIMEPRISRAAIERINEHAGRGERVILFSGMPDFLLANFASHLGVREYFGSIMKIEKSRFSGQTLGPFPLARGKVDALEMILTGSWDRRGFEETSAFAAMPNPAAIFVHAAIDWSSITFYADHWTDRYLLSKVGRPVVVNGKEQILKLAKEKGWTTEEWK